MELHTTQIGDEGSPVAFCHGVFGQGRNWTSVARALGGGVEGPPHQCFLLDMPNHGRSPWTDDFSYRQMADAVADHLETLVEKAGRPLTLVGHSMGGKIAMTIALTRPSLVGRLCVVDMSPVAYGGHRQFNDLIEAMRQLDLDTLSTRREAEEQMSELVPDHAVRAFLLQNLRRDLKAQPQNRWHWQPNVKVLFASMERLAGWELPDHVTPWDGPVLWVAGALADYVRPEYVEPMKALFPRARLVTIKDAGHWVHSEQPQIFTSWLRHFVDGPAV